MLKSGPIIYLPDVHRRLADWVKKGGVLIYCGRDNEPFQSIMEWWNTNGMHCNVPSMHLFGLLGIHPDSSNGQSFKVTVYVLRQNLKEVVMGAGGALKPPGIDEDSSK